MFRGMRYLLGENPEREEFIDDAKLKLYRFLPFVFSCFAVGCAAGYTTFINMSPLDFVHFFRIDVELTREEFNKIILFTFLAFLVGFWLCMIIISFVVGAIFYPKSREGYHKIGKDL